jgi:hypothetical protein
VLGSANRTINVVATKKEDVIVAEKRCKITLEDF